MAREVYTLSYIDVNPNTGDVNFDVTQLENWSMDPGLANIILKGAGEVPSTFIAVGAASPRFSFGTSQIKDMLDNLGNVGILIDAGAGPGVVGYMKQLQKGATRMSGASHLSFTVKDGSLLPRSIMATHGPMPAVMQAEVICTTDGTNDPIVIAKNQSIAVTPAASVGWVVGPAKINGVSLTGVQSLTVNFGLIEEIRGGEGAVFPDFVAVMGQQPRITVLTDLASYLQALGVTGVAQSATASVVSFRKLARGSTRVPETTAEHIRITIADGMIQPGVTTPAMDAAGVAAIDIIPVFDGSNAPMAMDTAAAINDL